MINKRLAEEELFRGVETLMEAGLPNLRLYFMVGLPGETDEDIGELIALAKKVRQQVVSAWRPRGRLGLVTLSLNAFVPKPWTPFQWEPMAGLKLVKSRMKRVQDELKNVGNVKVITDVPKYALLQGALSRGDRRLVGVVRLLGKGAAFGKAFKAMDLEPEFYANRRRPKEELLPWAFVDHSITMQYLWREAEKSITAGESGPCRLDGCTRCGVCPPTDRDAVRPAPEG